MKNGFQHRLHAPYVVVKQEKGVVEVENDASLPLKEYAFHWELVTDGRLTATNFRHDVQYTKLKPDV